MSDNLLKLRKACLLKKLSTGSTPRATVIQLTSFCQAAAQAKHMPPDPTAMQLALDELVAAGALRLDVPASTGKKAKPAVYVPGDKFSEIKAQLPEWPPKPVPKIDPTARGHVLLMMFLLGERAGTKKDIALPKSAGPIDKVLEQLAAEGVIAKLPRDLPPVGANEALNYRITDAGKRAIPSLELNPATQFKVSGQALTELMRLTGSAKSGVTAAPVTQPAASAPALTDDALMDEAKRLMREVGLHGMLPIYQIRRSIRGKFGPQAASHESLDPQIKQLRGKRLRLVSISDRSRATPDQLQDSIQGLEEIFFYVEELK